LFRVAKGLIPKSLCLTYYYLIEKPLRHVLSLYSRFVFILVLNLFFTIDDVVLVGTSYPCQMQKTQTFSCLFRHYAKHNGKCHHTIISILIFAMWPSNSFVLLVGLRKEDLIFFFTDELLQEQTPETVHLMPQDEIWVSHQKRSETPIEVDTTTTAFTESLRKVLNSHSHSDVVFHVGPNADKIIGHKAILSARSDYFDAMFRKGLIESTSNVVKVCDHDVITFKRAMEFIYTNGIQDIDQCDAQAIINLLILANEYILDDLKRLCSQSVAKLLNVDNIGKFMALCSQCQLSNLRETCLNFVRNHYVDLRSNQMFCSEIEQSPDLGLLLLEALPLTSSCSQSSDLFNDFSNSRKRVRVDDVGGRAHEIPSQTTNANMIQNGSFGSDL